MKKIRFDLVQRSYFEKVNESQFRWLTENPYIRQKEKELLWEILKTKPKKILEVGCGEGANIVNLKKFGFSGEFTGVDFSLAKINFAKKQAPFGRFLKANAYGLPFEKEQFTLVFCKNLLHHLSHPQKAIKEMVRVCQKKGEVVMIEANGRNLLNFFLGFASKSERGLLESVTEKLTKLVSEEKSLKVEKVTLVEPFNFFRALFHYRFGFPRLVGNGILWLKIDNFLGKFMFPAFFGYIVLKARKLNRDFV